METIINEQYNNLERIISTFSSLDSSSSWKILLFGCCTTVMIGSSVAYFYIRRRQRRSNTSSNKSSHVSSSSSSNNNSRRYDSNDITSTTTTTSENNSNKPMDAWEERRSRGVAIHSLHERKDESGKPFGSSYYYAHNNTKLTGGYKDGLRMEDFTMNQPRLLSKHIINTNKDNINNVNKAAFDENGTTNAEDRREHRVTGVVIPSSIIEQKRILNISKYLWDDPGSSDGIATIRIDVLPLNSTDNIPFENIRSYIHSDNIYTQILNNNEGLLIDIKTNATTDKTTNINYRLKIDSLYGPITSIKVIIKSKRLLIKLTKKYTMFDKSNLKTWPYPQKKKKCF